MTGPTENNQQTVPGSTPDESESVSTEQQQFADEPKLYPEDQARVDAFLERGVNSVERKPFRPILLMFMLIAVVSILSLFSLWLARTAGVH